MASEKMSSTGAWLDGVLKLIFFQPDDIKAEKTMDENLSPDLKVRINGVPMALEEYKASILATRAKYDMSLQFNKDVLANDSKADEASVAQLSNFILKDKQTGKELLEATVTLTTVKVVDGKRVLSELTEVYRSG